VFIARWALGGLQCVHIAGREGGFVLSVVASTDSAIHTAIRSLTDQLQLLEIACGALFVLLLHHHCKLQKKDDLRKVEPGRLRTKAQMRFSWSIYKVLVMQKLIGHNIWRVRFRF